MMQNAKLDTAPIINAILKRGQITLSDHSGTYRDEWTDSGYFFLIEIPYLITYTDDKYDYSIGPIEAGEPVDNWHEVNLTIRTEETDDDVIEALQEQQYQLIENEIECLITIE